MYYKCVIAFAFALSSLTIMIVSDALSCGVTYGHHSDDSRGIILGVICLKYRPHMKLLLVHYGAQVCLSGSLGI
jgi:hypothetical protein